MSAAYGIDCSKWQNQIDWRQVYGAGKRFAIVKASEGTTYQDPRHARHVAEARAAGLVIGHYHFYRPAYEPEEQAENFYRVVGPLLNGDLIPWIDVEVNDGRRDYAAIKQDIALMVLYCEERFGKPVGIYTSTGFWNEFSLDVRFQGIPLWIAHWGIPAGSPSKPASFGTWHVHQYTSSGAVAGILGNVDLNYCRDLESVQHKDAAGDTWKAQVTARLQQIDTLTDEIAAIVAQG